MYRCEIHQSPGHVMKQSNSQKYPVYVCFFGGPSELTSTKKLRISVRGPSLFGHRFADDTISLD